MDHTLISAFPVTSTRRFLVLLQVLHVSNVPLTGNVPLTAALRADFHVPAGLLG